MDFMFLSNSCSFLPKLLLPEREGMHKYLLNTFSVPGTVLGAKISVVRKTHKVSRSKEKREKRIKY